jgi:hypothetical protein
MKTITVLFIFTLLILQTGHAQPWQYDFGTSTGSFTTPSGTSTTFLPQPPSGEDFVRVGSAGGGIYLDNPGIADLGSATELRCVASSSASVNKFSVYDYSGSTAFTIKFTVRFGGGDSGDWSFFQGDGDNYSNGYNFYNDQTFTGLRWTFGSSDALTMQYNNNTTWTTLTGVMDLQNVNYTVEIYGNNGSASVNYNYNGAQSVAQNTFDLWVNGVLVGDDLAKSALTDGNNIDSYMFIGRSSSGNVANIYIDDITYTNIISDQPLPVELSSFSLSAGDRYVDLKWATESELDNLGFIILRSNEKDGEYRELASYEYFDELKGAGTTSKENRYHFRDETVFNGVTYWYKLCDVDANGIKTEHGPIKATPRADIIEVNNNNGPKEYRLLQNYPNPFNPTTTIAFSIPAALESSDVVLTIFNIDGKIIKSYFFENISGGNYEVIWNGKTQNGLQAASGMYFYQIKTEKFIEFKKMMLIR